jgi:twinkle protein
MNLISDVIDFDRYLKDTDHKVRVRPASDYAEEVAEYIEKGPGVRGLTLPWEKTYLDVRIRGGETTLWAGMNGHGKSMILNQVCLHLAKQGSKVCIASMEMKPVATLARAARQAFGGVPDRDWVKQFSKATDGLIWLYDQQGTVDPNKMLGVVRYAVHELGIEQFVIDSFMKCGIAEDDNTKQKWFLDELTSLARDLDIHLHLVVHSRKQQNEYVQPGKMDIRGSASIADQADNVITCWRNKAKEEAAEIDREQPDTIVKVDKQRHGEWEGHFGLWFDKNSLQYLADPYEAPRKTW